MYIYPENYQEKVGFDKIKEIIVNLCRTESAKSMAQRLKADNNRVKIETLLSQTEEYRQILMNGLQIPAQDFYDLRTELDRLKLEGTYIPQEKLRDLRSSLTTISNLLIFFKKLETNDYPKLKSLARNISVEKGLILEINKIITDNGDIKDSASENLKEIRQSIKSANRELERRMAQEIRQAKKNGLLADDIESTIRDGRPVIPVSASNKRKLKGLIHDESASGQTVFIEPEVVFLLNNELLSLKSDERIEIINILIEFTQSLRPYIYDLEKAYFFLVIIDFIQAKANFAVKINACKPIISPQASIALRKAIHPLLYLSFKKQKKQDELVPLSIDINKEDKITIISGPNAGGKSVCLKTVALLQYMLQSGLLISAKGESECGVFDNFLIDIGDDQSLENDLSTYSSHLRNMKEFTERANKRSLFFIDEFGTGTDPALGGAIAESILEHLVQKGAFGLISTHYSNLKIMAESFNEIVNAAMLYDNRNLRPLYVLEKGKPGSSFAFEIAQNSGLQKEIIDNAKSKVGYSQVNFENQIIEIEHEKKLLDKKNKQLMVADDLLASLVEEYQTKLAGIKLKKQEIISEARKQADGIIADSNKLIENTIKEIKEVKADKEKTREIRKNFEEKKEEIVVAKNYDQKFLTLKKKEADKIEKAKEEPKKEVEKVKLKNIKPEVEVIAKTISIGDMVRIVETGVVGELISISKNTGVILNGAFTIQASLLSLQAVKINNQSTRTIKQKSYNSILSNLNDRRNGFTIETDMRGMRLDDAMIHLVKYIDEAILVGIKEVSILHGKGTGALRVAVRNYLRSLDEVESCKDARVEFGGAGITLVKFR